MILSLSEAALLLNQYKYLILFPLAVFEGPIITVVAGFFVTLGTLNVFLVYGLVVLADITGDAVLYLLGRLGGAVFIRRVGPYLGIHQEKIDRVKKQFDLHRFRTLTLSKLFHGIGIAGLATAGIIKVPYKKYFAVCFLVSLAQDAVFLAIGLLFGHTYVQLSHYFDYFAAATVAVGLGLILYFVARKFKIPLIKK